MATKLSMKIFLVIFVLHCGSGPADAQYQREDETVILQYFNYIDIITRIKLDNMLAMSRNFVMQLLDSIPHEDRGNSAEMLQQFIDDAERVVRSGSEAQKEAVLLQLQELIGAIKQELVKQEREDFIIRRGLLGTFELLARLSIEDRKFHEKFVKATQLLRDKVTAEGEERYYNLFNLVNAIEAEQDIVQREQLTARYKELKDRIFNEIQQNRHRG